MATRRDRSKELRELARTIRRLMLEHEMANATRVKVSSALSRILKHDEGWRALRLRSSEGKREERLAKEPARKPEHVVGRLLGHEEADTS